MFPINAHDFYAGGCSCCSGKGKHFMEEEAVTMPTVDISFAPTKAFVNAFGEAEARKQGERFTQPSWAQKMQEPPVVLTREQLMHTFAPPKEEFEEFCKKQNPLLSPQEQAQVEQVPPAAFVVVGGIFLAGAAFGLFVAWRLGALSTATFTSP